jgi:hypothetical protein
MSDLAHAIPDSPDELIELIDGCTQYEQDLAAARGGRPRAHALSPSLAEELDDPTALVQALEEYHAWRRELWRREEETLEEYHTRRRECERKDERNGMTTATYYYLMRLLQVRATAAYRARVARAAGPPP